MNAAIDNVEYVSKWFTSSMTLASFTVCLELGFERCIHLLLWAYSRLSEYLAIR